MRHSSVIAARIALCATTLFLNACGGGGGSNAAIPVTGGSIPPPVGQPAPVPTPTPLSNTFTPQLVEYKVNPKSGIGGMAVGADGNLYYTESNNAAIGKITVSGIASDIPVPQSIGQVDLTAGPDGAIWFTDQASFVGRLDITSGATTVIPGTTLTTQNTLGDIGVGSDRNIWFGGSVGNVKVVSPASLTVIAQFPISPAGGISGRLVIAGDANLWCTDIQTNGILRITPGGVTSFFPLPKPGLQPNGIAVVGDGSLWFTEYNQFKIVHMATSGSLLGEIALPHNDLPVALISGPNNKLYVTVDNPLFGSAIDEIDPISGNINRFTRRTGTSSGIVVGPDANIWFIESGYVGKLVIH